MFAEGDYISHSASGVCRVAGITLMEVPGADRKKEYYILKPVYDRSATVYCPVETGKALKCRRIMTKEQAGALLDEISGLEQLTAQNPKELEERCRAAVQSENSAEWARAIKTLRQERDKRLSTGKRMTVIQERCLKLAEEKLCGELAVSLGMEREKVEELLIEKMAAKV